MGLTSLWGGEISKTSKHMRPGDSSRKLKRTQRSARPELVALAGGELVAKPALSFLELSFLKGETQMRLSKKLAAVTALGCR
jgi:hypothetical protein